MENDFMSSGVPESVLQRVLGKDLLSSPYPYRRDTPTQRIRAKEEAEPGFGEIVGAGFTQENLVAAGIRKVKRSGAKPDPEWIASGGVFGLPKEQFDVLTEGVPPKYWSALDGTRSLYEATILTDQLKRLEETEQILANAGWGGFGARLLGAMVDPAAIGVGLITGGTASLAFKARSLTKLTYLATKGSRRNVILAGGLLAGSENALAEYALARENPTRGITDMIMAFSGGVLLGGIFTGVSTRNLKHLRLAADDLQNRIIVSEAGEAVSSNAGINPTTKLRDLLKSQDPDDHELLVEVATNYADTLGLEGADRTHFLDGVKNGGADASFGAILTTAENAARRNPAVRVGIDERRAEELAWSREHADDLEVDVSDPTRTSDAIEQELVEARQALADAESGARVAEPTTEAAAPEVATARDIRTRFADERLVGEARTRFIEEGSANQLEADEFDAWVQDNLADIARDMSTPRVDEPTAAPAVAPRVEGVVMFRGAGEGSDTDTGFQWFSETEGLAERYADFRGGTVEQRRINVRNPLNVNGRQVLSPRSFVGQALSDLDPKALDRNAVLSARKDFLNHFGDEEIIMTDFWSSEGAKEATRRFLLAVGFDGISMKEGGTNTIATLSKEQILTPAAPDLAPPTPRAAEAAPSPELAALRQEVADLEGQLARAKEIEAVPPQREQTRVATSLSGGRTIEGALQPHQSVHAAEFKEDIAQAADEIHGTSFPARDVTSDEAHQALKDADPDYYHASPSCKNFSKAKLLATADENDLAVAQAVARDIREVKPPVVTLEQVVDYRGTDLLKIITDELGDYNWDILEVDAANYGGASRRPRMILRAVRKDLDVELPKLPPETGPRDWWEAIKDLVEDAPDSEFRSKTPGEKHWELQRHDRYVDQGKLTRDEPIITMGGSGFKDQIPASNPGGPAPVLKSTPNEVPRIILPDGRVKRVTPRMMARLMGLPDSYKLPGGDSPTLAQARLAKVIIGNGVHGDITRKILQPMVDIAGRARRITPEAPRADAPVEARGPSPIQQRIDELKAEIARIESGRVGGEEEALARNTAELQERVTALEGELAAAKILDQDQPAPPSPVGTQPRTVVQVGGPTGAGPRVAAPATDPSINIPDIIPVETILNGLNARNLVAIAGRAGIKVEGIKGDKDALVRTLTDAREQALHGKGPRAYPEAQAPMGQATMSGPAFRTRASEIIRELEERSGDMLPAGQARGLVREWNELDALHAQLQSPAGKQVANVTERIADVMRDKAAIQMRLNELGQEIPSYVRAQAQEVGKVSELTIGKANEPGTGTTLTVSTPFRAEFDGMEGELVGVVRGTNSVYLKFPGSDELHLFRGYEVQRDGVRFGKAKQDRMNRVKQEGHSAEQVAKLEAERLEAEKAVPDPPPPKQAGDLFLGGKGNLAYKSRWGGARISMVGQLGSHQLPQVRAYAAMIAQDAVHPDGIVQFDTAGEWGFRNFQAAIAPWWAAARPAYNSWAKKRGRRAWDPHSQREFFENVTHYLRRGAEAPDPDLQAAVEQMRKTFLTLFESGKRHNVRGLENVPYKATYVPRFYDIGAIYKALERDGGHENLVRLFTKALMNEHNRVKNADGVMEVVVDAEGELKLPEDRARRWAKGLVDVLLDQESYTDLERSHIVSGNAKQLVRTFLTSRVDDSGAPSFSPDDIKAIMNLLGQGTRKKGDEGTPLTAALDRRNELDETTSIDIGNGETLNLEQLLINDSRELVEVYAKQMTGAIGATELLSEMGQITGKTFTHPSDLMAYLRREMNKARIAPAKIDSDMEKITTMMNSLRGKRLHQGKTYDNFLRNIRLYNLFRVGGQFGIASLPEFGQIAGSVGFSAMLRQMPALRQVFKHGADGTLKNPLLQELQVFVATGLGWRNSEVLRRMDLGDATPEMDTGPKGIGAERARKASRIFNVMSGLTPVHIMQQRWAASLIAQRFADMAWGRKTMGPRRLAMLGLTPEMGEKIMKAMRHASREEGMFGIRLTKLNLDQWTGDEAEAASALIGAIGRFSSRVVQENDIGNLSKWMTTEIGKTILQFRTFPAVAYEKQFLSKGAMIADGFRGEREMAWHSVMEALSAMTIAGLAYHAQTTINSVGRKDREEYLKEALSTKKTIAVAWQRAGWSTFLPDAMDTAAYFGGADSNLFTGRTSGLNISSIRSFEGLLSNPSFDLMTKAGGSMRDLVKNLGKDNDFTRDEWRKFYGLLPFTRLTPLMILGDSLGGTLPEDN